MKFSKLLTLAVLVSGLAISVWAGPIDGSWKSDFPSPVGDMHYIYTFKTDGDKVTGTAKSDNGETTLDKLVVMGNDISFTENLMFGGMTIAIDYKGTIDGDQIKFKRHIGDFGDDEIVANRVK
jgi:hypothetical protein